MMKWGYFGIFLIVSLMAFAATALVLDARHGAIAFLSMWLGWCIAELAKP